jgi:putative NIF3 family GTP cyclohydrolase 1 type 2
LEGRNEMRRIDSGVRASIDLIQAAFTDGADAIVVHHGHF